jgi:hypothetical protein
MGYWYYMQSLLLLDGNEPWISMSNLLNKRYAWMYKSGIYAYILQGKEEKGCRYIKVKKTSSCINNHA